MIALDARPLQNESAGRGVGRYIRSLISHLPEGDDEYLFLESRWKRPGELPAGTAGTRVRLLRPPRAITLFDQLTTPLLCAVRGIDIFHSTFYALPRFAPGRTRRVLTVHDLIPILLPGAAGRRNTAIFAAIYRSARVADAVIVPSLRTARDLEERIGVRRDRIRVVPMGVAPPFAASAASGGGTTVPTSRHRASPAPQRDSGVAGRDGAGSPRHLASLSACERLPAILDVRPPGGRILLYVGGFDPSKNVPFLFEALARVADERVVLALAGDPGRRWEALRAAAGRAGVERRVARLGRLSEGDLAAAYRTADLFVSASLYEGFGLPALEAMACGCPVVALEAGTVPEVLEGAAISVRENDPAVFASAIVRALADEDARRSLITSGLKRASELTWERTARETLAVYREVPQGREGGRA